MKRGLSAGRVQSVALRLVADREEEINAFIPEEYWTLDAVLKIKGEKRPLVARFYGTDKKKMTIRSEQELNEILKKIENAAFEITDIRTSERIRKAPLPFTTSTLQQEAAKALNFGTQKTMRIAQQLYEGIDIKGNGTVGVITYLRTDSTRIADEADAAARDYISGTYGKEYAAPGQRLQTEEEDPGCARGDPAYGYCKNTGVAERFSDEGSVPPVPADLEAFCRQPDDCGEI